MMSWFGGRCGGEHNDERGEGELEFLIRRVRGRRRRVGVVAVSVHLGVEVHVGDDGGCFLSGGPRSFFWPKSLGGGSVAMLANVGQAALSSPSGLT